MRWSTLPRWSSKTESQIQSLLRQSEKWQTNLFRRSSCSACAPAHCSPANFTLSSPLIQGQKIFGPGTKPPKWQQIAQVLIITTIQYHHHRHHRHHHHHHHLLLLRPPSPSSSSLCVLILDSVPFLLLSRNRLLHHLLDSPSSPYVCSQGLSMLWNIILGLSTQSLWDHETTTTSVVSR